MCGIAGYNVKPDWARENLANGEVAAQIDLAWRYNEHRGTDAAGFFCHLADKDDDGNTLLTFKHGESASKMLKDTDLDLTTIPAANVFGAHTRASTLGSPSDDKNNHPVVEGNVWVTHNGHIRNHDDVRRGGDKTKMPEVDSHAIAYALSKVKDPWNIGELVDALKTLKGGYAIHAVWANIPGLSLIARGDSSPLIVRYNPKVGIVYSSEIEASWMMVAQMGFDPKEWELSDMDQWTAMLFFDGEPIAFYSWMPEPTSNTRGNIRYARMIEDEEVYSTDWTKDFAATVGKRHFDEVPESLDLQVVMDEGVPKGKESNRKIPHFSDGWLGARAHEADVIYSIKNNERFFIFVNGVQIVTDRDGKILDLINPERSTGDRWQQNMTKHSMDQIETFGEFLEEFSSFVYDCKEPPNPKFETRREHTIKYYPSDHGAWSVDVWDDDDLEELIDLEAGEIVTLGKWGKLWKHQQNDALLFRKNVRCAEHEQNLMNHALPLQCMFVKSKALEVYALFEHVDLFRKVNEESTITLVPSPGLCNKACDFKVEYFATIELDVDNSYLVPVGEECRVCSSTRWLDKMPAWVEEYRSVKQLELKSE